jgi:acyl carrier protein
MHGELESDIARNLRGIFTEILQVDVPPDGAGLVSNGLIDSLALVELLFEIEKRFKITVDFEHLETHDFETLEAIEELIVRSPTSQPAVLQTQAGWSKSSPTPPP